MLDLTQTDGVDAKGKGEIWLATSGANQSKAGREQLVRMFPGRAWKIPVEDIRGSCRGVCSLADLS